MSKLTIRAGRYTKKAIHYSFTYGWTHKERKIGGGVKGVNTSLPSKK